jgi:hypothetical protein
MRDPVAGIDPAAGASHRVRVNHCQANHFWPAKRGKAQPPCPICTRTAVKEQQTLDVFVPTNRSLDDVEWACPPNAF